MITYTRTYWIPYMLSGWPRGMLLVCSRSISLPYQSKDETVGTGNSQSVRCLQKAMSIKGRGKVCYRCVYLAEKVCQLLWRRKHQDLGT